MLEEKKDLLNLDKEQRWEFKKLIEENKYSSNANMKKLWGNTCPLPLTIRSIVNFPKRLGFEQKMQDKVSFSEKTKGKGFIMLENILENTKKTYFHWWIWFSTVP